MKKNSRVRRWLAMILCMTLVLSSNVVSMAAEENGTEVQAITEEPVIEETEPAAADEPVPEDITETETLMTETSETVPTEEPTEEPVDTEVPTETVTEPETPEVPETPETPTQDETEEPVEMETPAMPEAPGAQEEPGAPMEKATDDYPLYLHSQGMADLKNGRAHYAKENYDMRYEGGKWICCWYDDNKEGAAATMGPRNTHYITIDDSWAASKDEFRIAYIRCDMYGGEEQGDVYYPVFFIDKEGNSLLKDNGKFWESVKQGTSPKKTPDMKDGYWTLGKYDGGLINKEDQLKQVTDTKEEAVPEGYSINTQTVFIWHPNLEFTKVSEEKDDKGNNKPLKGAEFKLFLNGEPKGTAISGEDGKVTFKNLEFATYTLKETQAPEGYITPETEWSVKIGKNGTTTILGDGVVKDETTKKYQILNKREGGELNFTKTDTAGVALPGAEFALYATDDEKYENSLYTGTSDEFGNVKITGIPVGTYTMKETKAPTDYLVSGLVWTVEATKENDTIKVVLKSGEKEITSIENRRNNEYFEEDVSKDKRAELLDWNARTYKLSLTADSEMKTTIEGKVNPIDVVLVLDVSGSMEEFLGYGMSDPTDYKNLDEAKTYYFTHEGITYKADYSTQFATWMYKKIQGGVYKYKDLTQLDGYQTIVYYGSREKQSRLDGLKEAAKVFVDTLAEQSPNSRVGITTFSTSAKRILGLTNVKSDTIKTEINKLVAGGSTYPSGAIKSAGEMLNTKNNEHGKHVIFLTDGDCGYSDGSADKEEIGNCKAEADKLKKAGVNIHAIRFATSNAKYLEDIVTDVETNTDGEPIGPKVYGANDVNGLIESLNFIIKDSVKNVPISGATIIDVIDKHFVVTDDEGKPLEDGDLIYPNTNPVQGKLVCDSNGNQKVIWENQTIGIKKDGVHGWEATIYIKAKENYIGGNGVTTNGSDSGIYIGDSTTPLTTFPVPEVNVKADLAVEDTETTIFLGEVVPTDGVQENMFQMSGWLNKYEDVIESDFIFEWYKDEACKKPISLAEMKAEKPESQTKYYLKVTYHAGNPADSSHSQMNGHVNGRLENSYTIEDKGVYTVNVVSGTIKIHKVLEGTNNIQLEGAPTFTFKIEYTSPEGGSTQVSYKTVKFNNENVTELWTEELTNLPKGDYKITELETLKFKNTSITAEDDTTCASESANSQITFHIGTAKAGVEDVEDRGQMGVAKFVNKKTGDNGKRTDTDVRVNRFTKDSDGNWTWKGHDLSTSKPTSDQQ